MFAGLLDISLGFSSTEKPKKMDCEQLSWDFHINNCYKKYCKIYRKTPVTEFFITEDARCWSSTVFN